MPDLLLLDSISDIANSDALSQDTADIGDMSASHELASNPLHCVAISGSHGGLHPAALASSAGLHAAIFNDAGLGFRKAGVAGILQLDKVAMAAAAVDAYSCLMGNAEDMQERGIISTCNQTALKAGVATGMPVAEAASLLQSSPTPDARMPAPVSDIKVRKVKASGARVLLLDSASMVNNSHIDQWVITGSHGALIGGNPQRALNSAAALAVFNDAGNGFENCGTSRLPPLAERGIAAVTVDCNSALIGNAESAFETGIISAANRVAEHKGAHAGQHLQQWLSTLPPPADYTLAQIDDQWRAVDVATLVFVLNGTNVLLIRKKRGLGAGKINGPGGKLDPGESPRECAIREVEEELKITPADLHARGELRFQFADGYSIHVHVFVAHNYSGLPQETEEAVPLWFPVDEIPYDEMWEDDRMWLPQVLNRQTVDGRFIFEDDRILEHEVNFRLPAQY